MIFCAISVLTSIAQTVDTVTIDFPNGQLSGTLTTAVSSDKTPIVYIISGSGPNDRDGNQIGMKPNSHLMLSDALVAQGISTLRVDKRMSGESIFEMKSEEDISFDTFVSDANAWLDLIGERNDFSDIIVLGHSQGSLVGMLAAQNNDRVDAIISLAGPSEKVLVKMREQIYAQTPVFKTGLEPIFSELEKGNRVDSIPPMFNSIFRSSIQPFLISWNKYNPREEISKLKIPIAIVQGATDFQVTVDDANGLYAAQPNAEFIIVEGMNHVLKEAPKNRIANMKTYSDPELPLIDGLVDNLVRFIKESTKK